MLVKNILIVDDHAVMRKGMNEILREQYPHVVIHEAGDVEAMLDYFKKHTVDLLIMDVQMPDTNTVNIVELVSIKYPSTRILIFSMMPAQIYSRRLMQAGAVAYLQKDSPINIVKETVHSVLHSSSASTGKVVFADTNSSMNDPFAKLSHREFEILDLLLKGQGLNNVASDLNLKPSTVGTYKARIFQKLLVKNIFELKELSQLYNFSFNNNRSYSDNESS